jgi:hypothetical protein
MKTQPFEHCLRAVVLHAQHKINLNCFAMYQPPYLTISYFDDNNLVILADTRVEDDYTIAFSELYSQINQLLTGKRNPLEGK